jgi:hypothetical protein
MMGFALNVDGGKGARSGLCRSPYNGAVLVDDRRKDTQGEIAKDDERDRWYKQCRDSTKYARQREGIQGLYKVCKPRTKCSKITKLKTTS